MTGSGRSAAASALIDAARRSSALPGGSGVHVTRHVSAPATWLDDVPRTWRTPSTMWFIPWM